MQPRVRPPYRQGHPRMMQPPMMRGNYPPMNRMGQNMRPPRQSGGGGLLSKILGRGGRNRASTNPFSIQAPTAAASRAGGGGGILKTLTDPNALNGFLTNTQKVLNTAQQIGPMVQQYGPLVKNLPSLWKLYKGFKDLPETDSNDDSPETPQEEAPQNKRSTTTKRRKKDAEEVSQADRNSQSSSGQSVPKLYI